MSTQTISINGRLYNAITGLPVEDATLGDIATAQTPEPARVAHATTPSQAIHAQTTRSTTLRRKSTKNPHSHARQTAAASVKARKAPQTSGRLADVTNPTRVQRQAPVVAPVKAQVRPAKPPVAHKAVVQPAQVRTAKRSIDGIAPNRTKKQANPDAPAVAHPIVSRVHAVQQQRKVEQRQNAAIAKAQQPDAAEVKKAVIAKSLANTQNNASKHKNPEKKQQGRLLGFASAFAALLLFTGYLTYLNVPNISVRVAAAQAGIDASYPGYHPDGYRLNGPVAYSDGRVNISYAANTGTGSFQLSQSRSNWDSSSLLENYVKAKVGDNYTTTQDRGLTIYSFDGDAAWVNKGILYTIEGDAPLTSDQIRKIATSA